MSAFYTWLKIWLNREDGQDLIEYAVIIALILFAAVVGMGLVGDAIAGMWTTITGWLNGLNVAPA